jgi:hypothetical protein
MIVRVLRLRGAEETPATFGDDRHTFQDQRTIEDSAAEWHGMLSLA